MRAGKIGERIERIEDSTLLFGTAQFVDDLEMDGVLHAAFVRSPHAHAKFNAIDTSAAEALAGVHAVFTMRSFAQLAQGRTPLTFPHPALKQGLTQFPLAVDEVCYVGECIAVVVAESRHVAEDAAALVEVSYDALPAVIDCQDALKGQTVAHQGAPDNIVAHLKGGFGDVTACFARAAHVVTDTIRMHRGGCHSMEPRGVLARYARQSHELTIWSSTQSPYSVSRFVAQYLGMETSDVRVIAPNVGGGFGPKAAVYPEEYVIPLAAMMLNRPVKWIEDRSEHFVSTTQQRDQIWTIEIGADANGKILALRGHGVHDHGAYVPYGLLLPLTSMSPFPGPYTLQAVELQLDVVFTNATPTSPIRGAGRPYAAFVIERAVDRIAQHMKIDRAEIRRRNFVQPTQMPYPTGMLYRDGSIITYDSGDYPACLEKALQMADYEGFPSRRAKAQKQGRALGIGIASYIEDTGVGPYEGATVRVLRTGKVLIETGAPSQGQGHATVFAQICADVLGVDIASIDVRSADTGRFPMGVGAIGSRIAVTAGSSVFQAAQSVRQKAVKLAATLLNVGEQAIEVADGKVQLRGDATKSFTFGDLAQRLISAPGVALPEGFTAGLESTAYFPASSAIPYANGTHVVEVEVDTGTGLVRVLKYSVAHDCGNMINPLIVDGQILGGVVHGLGNALLERMEYDQLGQPLTTNYGEYLLPIASDIPRIEIAHLVSPSPRNPLGVKGAGEGGTIPAAAAVVSAVEDALSEYGVRLNSHPLTPQYLIRSIAASGL